MIARELVWEAAAFGLTVAIESPLFAWISGLGLRRVGLFCLLMNCATWFAMVGVQSQWDVPVPALEGGVIVAEAVIIAWFWSWRAGRALGASLLLNLSSWLLGETLLSAIMARI
jgi:hypothetical protein